MIDTNSENESKGRGKEQDNTPKGSRGPTTKGKGRGITQRGKENDTLLGKGMGKGNKDRKMELLKDNNL